MTSLSSNAFAAPPRDSGQVAGVEVFPVRTGAEREAFIRLPWALYEDDPAWVPPLLRERRRHLDPAVNPSLRTMDSQLWLARMEGRPVGRISAQVNHAHLARYDDGAGHFGFLEAVESEAVVAALLETAEKWLRARGMRRALGPFNFSINEECGLLTKGFGTPPSIMMPHGRPCYPRLVEACGYAKAVDMIAYRFDMAKEAFPEGVRRMVDRVRQNPAVRMRGLRWSSLVEDIRCILDIFNDAWSGNWGFIPFSEEEITHAARELKPLIHEDSVCIAELDGEPAAFAFGLPNLNEAIRDLDGRLLPFGWARLMYRLKFHRIRSGRMPLMGLRRRLHSTLTGAGLSFAAMEAVQLAYRRRGVVSAELSWVLENNTRLVRILERIGAVPYKTYRIYARDL